MRRSSLTWLGLAWGVALLPLVCNASPKVTVSVWAFLLTFGIICPDGARARRCVVLYLLFVSFPVADYIGMPVSGFVGGAPSGLAYYPADFWLLLGLGLAIAEGSLTIPGGPLRLLFYLGLFWIVAGVPSLFVASRPVAAFEQWASLPRAMIACLLVYSQAATSRSRLQLVWALLAGFVFQSAVAVAQHVRGDVVGLAWLGEAPAEYLTKAIAPGVVVWRSGGTMGHPNILATFLVGLLPLCVAMAIRPDEHRAVRAGVLAMLGVGLGAIVWTYSRGAWVSLVVVALYVLLVGVRKLLKPRIIVPAAVVSVILLMLAFPTVQHRLTQTESSATDVRLALIPVALKMAASHPLSGVGLNQFAERTESYDPAMELELFRHPVHNIVLLDLAEAGVLVGIASLLFWASIVVVAAVNIRRAIVQQAPVTAAFWLGAGCITLHNVADWTLRRPEILLLLFSLLALGSAASEGLRRGERGD